MFRAARTHFDLMGALPVKFGIPIKTYLSLPSSASTHICINVYIHVYIYVDICIFLKDRFALFCSVIVLHLPFTEYCATEYVLCVAASMTQKSFI